ncbi:MAG: GGDEF domain-containing response regulator [Geobacteraceae bacterium]|nr:GGDEF domain-containing response regulator [Geobacteraceae bacterium]
MNDKTIQLLLIEDNPGDERLLSEMLKEIGSARISMTAVASLDEALRIIGYVVFDLILLDLNLPDSEGLETFRRIQEAAPDVPAVILSGMDDEDIAVGAVQAGAQDYLIKGEVDGKLLVRSLRYAIERHKMREALKGLSLIDELTGLYNRRGFLTLAVQQLKTADRLGQRMMLLFADMDGLKWINDNLGHAEGDLAVRETADIFRETFRESDIIARFGGDEFAVLVMETGGESEEAVTDRLTGNLETHNAWGDRSCPLSLSMGIAHYDPAAPCSIEELLEQADFLMYGQKKAKKKS